MFPELDSSSTPHRLASRVSLALHAVVFAWLLRAPQARSLNANPVAPGRNGSVTQLYFPTQSPDQSATSSSDQATQFYRHQHLGHRKLILQQNAERTSLWLPRLTLDPQAAQNEAETPTLSKLGHGGPAGLPYGSMPGGPVYGNEIRPALPVTMPDPVVYPWELPESEGNVVIEFTIDERGEIVNKTVIQSMGPKLDGKALEAAGHWHFSPATQNGVAIASKQDYIFHFRARG